LPLATCAVGRDFPVLADRYLSLLHVPSMETVPRVSLGFRLGLARFSQAPQGRLDPAQIDHLTHLRPSKVRRRSEVSTNG
jgi:hypothetical protein